MEEEVCRFRIEQVARLRQLRDENGKLKRLVEPLNCPEVKAKSDEQLTTIISKGQGKMSSYAGKLSDDEIKAAVAYVRSLK